MKILIVNTYGKIRSTGKIATLQYEYLKSKGHEVKVAYRGIREPDPQNEDYISISGHIEPYVANVLARVTGLEGHVHPMATRRLKKLTVEFNPDVVQLISLHGYYINGSEYINYLKKNNIPAVYTMIDEYPYMGKCPYSMDCSQFKTGCKGGCPQVKNYPQSLFFDTSKFIWESKRKAYDGYNNIVFTGPGWVVERAKQSALLRDKQVEVLDEPIHFQSCFYPRNTESLREKLGIPDNNIIIVIVASLSAKNKGGRFFYEAARKLQNRRDITFVYVGVNTDEPFHLENLIPVSYVYSQEELADYYSLGDAFVSCSLADTQPNACLEAMGCGTPLIAFDAMGLPYIATEETMTLVEAENVDALVEAFEQVKKKDDITIKKCRDYALGRYSANVVMGKLCGIYDKLVKQ